ncbi:hypothetical protein GCM10026987_24010 [Belliella aquatica]|uniref:Trypsin-co-occurring domain-containing protein n=2 Tax=Belliella aquatica TaxID=1323734 RepID=A0ABQ1N520_9BACT|nr:hypothetical protein GCM10010993_35630 [Belliella aquatica]
MLALNSTFAQTNSVNLNNVMTEISEVLNELENSSSLPAPGEVIVTLLTENSSESNVGLKVLIFKVGRKWNRAESNEMKFKFTIAPKEGIDKVDIKKQLSEIIRDAINQVNNASNPNLLLKEFSVKISFTLEKSNSASGEFELSPVTPSASRSTKKKAVHTIEIVFNKQQ